MYVLLIWQIAGEQRGFFGFFFFFASASSQLSLVQNNPYAKVALRVAYFATLQLTASVPFLMPIL
jgi:hypothetical protein